MKRSTAILVVVVGVCVLTLVSQGRPTNDPAAPTLTVRSWQYANGAATVQFGNTGDEELHISDISYGKNEWFRLGQTVAPCRTLTIRTAVDSEPCAAVVRIGQSNVKVELNPFLRR